jgi:hypothetical protein
MWIKRAGSMVPDAGEESEQQGENAMPSFDRFATLAAALLATAVSLPARAGAFDLTGAWATDADMCSRVFTKKDNQIGFAELSDLYGSGFIVDGNWVRGKAAQCTIDSRKQEGDSIELSAACASSIMTQNLKFNLKINR